VKEVPGGECRVACGIGAACATATNALLAELGANGFWVGELSSSALSTATAVIALATVDRAAHAELIAGGLRWLAAHQNADGGWGDTVKSRSNISTTALSWAAFGAAGADGDFATTVENAAAWLSRASAEPPGSARVSRAGVGVPADANFPARAPDEGAPAISTVFKSSSRREATTSTARPPASPLLPPPPPRRDACAPQALAAAIARRYGKDRTFSVPILMALVLGGRLGADGWSQVMRLPFELAALPHQVFGALRLPVVSYALPALIAIGQATHHHHPTRNPVLWLLRALSKKKTLRVLESIQPPNGGFLEATPLTSFVTMALASCGQADRRVVRRGVTFLRASVQPDGSWPIDTNLATWVTTLAIKALAHQPAALTPEQRLTLREWLLGQQYRTEHPYTHAAPGGWAWTDLPGGVPDADDTPGALLALLHLGTVDAQTRAAGLAGVLWLLHLQNRDGGIPTFCRGWGALPFDRSSPDLTAHTLRAWSAWWPQLDDPLKKRTRRAINRALNFLAKHQRADGSWLPLWFGNEHAPDDENPTYGTAKVVIALRDLRNRGHAEVEPMLRAGLQWLADAQNDDHGWGGVRGAPSSMEETGLAVEALAGTEHVVATDCGAAWLVERVESGAWREPAPVGFYFAKLWYCERLYPQIFATGALGKVVALSRAVVSD
jgi:squalene-hopene/tetraprenyl-beta-curcumene cyclase